MNPRVSIITSPTGECWPVYRDALAAGSEEAEIARQAFNEGLKKGYREACKKHDDEDGARFGLPRPKTEP